jgi:hypothetical protein
MSDVKMSIITVNGVDYVPFNSCTQECVDGMQYCVIRTQSAGVHIGFVKTRGGQEVTLVNSRRLWYWEGAMTLSEVAVTGISKPDSCKVACVVPTIILTNAIEIIPCTEKAKKIIENIKVWIK